MCAFRESVHADAPPFAAPQGTQLPRMAVATSETTSQTDSLLPQPAPAPPPPERFASEMVTSRPSSVALTPTPRLEQPAMKSESESADASDAVNLPQFAASAVHQKCAWERARVCVCVCE